MQPPCAPKLAAYRIPQLSQCTGRLVLVASSLLALFLATQSPLPAPFQHSCKLRTASWRPQQTNTIRGGRWGLAATIAVVNATAASMRQTRTTTHDRSNCPLPALCQNRSLPPSQTGHNKTPRPAPCACNKMLSLFEQRNHSSHTTQVRQSAPAIPQDAPQEDTAVTKSTQI